MHDCIENYRKTVGLYKLVGNNINVDESPFLSFDYATNAFEQTLYELDKLENSILTNPFVARMIILEWFLALESFLSNLYRIYVLNANVDNKEAAYENFIRKNLYQRINKLTKDLGYAKEDIIACGYNEDAFSDLRSLRNQIIHEKLYITGSSYKCVNFSKNIFMLQQSDIMKVTHIILSIFNVFRYVVPGLDLFPNAIVRQFDTYFFVDMLEMYSEVALNSYCQILQKFNLSLDKIDLKIVSKPLLESKALRNLKPCAVAISADESGNILPKLNATNICRQNFLNFVWQKHVNYTQFGMPNYTREK